MMDDKNLHDDSLGETPVEPDNLKSAPEPDEVTQPEPEEVIQPEPEIPEVPEPEVVPPQPEYVPHQEQAPPWSGPAAGSSQSPQWNQPNAGVPRPEQTHQTGQQQQQQYAPGTGYPYSSDPRASQSGSHGYVAPTNSKAVLSLILGIVSVVLIFFAWALVPGLIGIAAGIAAIIVGVMARKEIDASKGRESGNGLATAGLIMGIVGMVLSALFTIACAACFGLFTSGIASNFSSWY